VKRIFSNGIFLVMALAPFIGQAVGPLGEGERIAWGAFLAVVGIWSARYVLGCSWAMSLVMFVPGFLVGAMALFMWCLEECGWWYAWKSKR
jgi:hypothetical protein